jgi:hypothetical protein
MRNLHQQIMEQWTVDEVTTHIPEAKNVLRERNISAGRGISLANMAAATGNPVDELTAAMHYRMRRAARQVRVEEAPVAQAEEAELVV